MDRLPLTEGEMALHASGMRETARVLHVSLATVIQEFHTRHLTSYG